MHFSKTMKTLLTLALLTTLASAGDKQLFNGTDLTGWEGNAKFWSVEDGTITGTTTAENPTKGNTFLIWKEGEPSDFTLTLKYKMMPGDDKKFTNSGIQYRSHVVDAENFVVGGYQADFEYGDNYSGILYEEKGRGILAKRSEQVVITQGENPAKPKLEVTGTTGDTKEIQAGIDKDGWNGYKIVAEGNHVQHFINGKLTIDVTDNTAEAPTKGVIALQVHAGAPMKVQFKDLVLTTK
jgi:hypothetical protein